MSASDPIQLELEQGLAHHRAGRLAEAERIYRGVLARYPNHPPAIGLLGAIAHQTGNINAAEELLRRSARLGPGSAGTHNNLGLVQVALGKVTEAAASFEEALRIDPHHLAAGNNLGEALYRLGRREEAVQRYQRVLELHPDSPDALSNLGDLMLERGLHDQAVALHRRAIEAAPDHAGAYSNLGKAMAEVDAKAAAEAFVRAIELQPAHVVALTNLSLLRILQGYPAQALELQDRAIALAPTYPVVHMDRALALLPLVRIDEAIASLRKALELDPNLLDAYDNLLWALLFDPHARPADVFSEFRNWAARFADPVTANASPPPRSSPPTRARLRIGYVSGDFRDHAVAHFIEPVLAAHDPSRVDIFCYSNVRKPDDFTRRMQSYPHTWRDIAGRSDDAVFQQIRDDGIDVLIDLAGHSARHKLLLFARRPAPVQVTWLGYPNTTGMRAMDYWITDPHCDPPGLTEAFASERLVRLPQTFTCYRPPDEAPPVNDLPALSCGRVTFASFNMAAKMNDDVMALWARVLADVPQSRLLITTAMVRDPDVHAAIAARLARHGVALDRLDIRPAQDVEPYLRTHHEVDIILDTFPFTGHTVTLNALWMGCPVVTLAGKTHISRRGVSVMSNLGLERFIAQTPEQYVEIARSAADDRVGLAELRRTLRDRLLACPLLDAVRFTQHLESAYRDMWANWCNQ